MLETTVQVQSRQHEVSAFDELELNAQAQPVIEENKEEVKVEEVKEE